MSCPRALVALAILPFLSAGARAQWSSDPLANLAVCAQPGDQAVPEIAAVGDGRTWVGWFDNRSGSYALYVQLLDRDGVPQLPADGLLVSANPQSTALVGWDLEADPSGDAVLVFTDTRAGSDLDVYAYRITPAGSFAWGPNGVTLSANDDYEPSPNVARLDDGSFAFVWSRSPSSGGGSVRHQRLDAAGTPLHAPEGLAISGTASERPGFADVVPGGGATYVVQWLRDVASFSSPRHIRAQKFDGAGAPLWPAFAPVYDAGPVPIAYWPVVQPDGQGGAVFAWHRSSVNTFDCLVQRLDANGLEVFPHNGVEVVVAAGLQEFSPSLAWLEGSQEMIVACNQRNGAQSQWATRAQRISSGGLRLWGDAGVELAPLDGVTESFERCVPFGDGAIVAWFESTGFGQTRVLARRLDGAGADVWGPAPVAVSSLLSAKDDLEVAIDGAGSARFAWHDERSDQGDVYAQDVNEDGLLGPATTCDWDRYCVGAPNSAGPGASIAVTGSTSVAHGTFGLVGTGCPPNVNGYFLYGSTQVQVPLGDGFRCVGGTLLRLQPAQSSGAGGAIARAVDFDAPPANGGPGALLPGSTWNFQLYYRDPLGPGGNGANLSDAASVTFCP